MLGNLAPAVFAGAFSAALYYIVTLYGLSFLFLFLPTLPIFWLGLKGLVREMLIAAGVGYLLVALSGPVYAFMAYGMVLIIPACYISYEALKIGGKNGLVIWYPLTAIFARLMTAAVFVLLLVTLLQSREAGGLPAILTGMVKSLMDNVSAELKPQDLERLQKMAPTMALMMLPVAAWVWALCLYIHAWVMNRELIRQNRHRRPDFSVIALPPPNWMISLLLLAALASLAGSPPMLGFWGKNALIMSLFPYFLFGMGLIYRQIRHREQRLLLLFGLYVLLFTVLWTALAVAAYGVFYHLRLLNKYLSSGGGSFKN